MSASASNSHHTAKDTLKDTGKDGAKTRTGSHDGAAHAEGNGNGNGHHGPFNASFALMPMEAGLAMLKDWRELAAVSAENMEENIRLMEDGWRDLSACQNPLDFSRAAGRLGFAYSQFVTTAGQRVASVASDCAARHRDARGDAMRADAMKAAH